MGSASTKYTLKMSEFYKIISFICFATIFAGVLSQNNTKHPFDIYDTLNFEANLQLTNLTYELYIEAIMVQRQIFAIQDKHEGNIAFEIGLVMGVIRERYKRMIDIYKQGHYMTKHLRFNNKTNLAELNPTYAMRPAAKMYYPLNWVVCMEYMRVIEIDIDKMIHVLESIPDFAFEEPVIEGQQKKRPERPLRPLRMGQNETNFKLSQHKKKLVRHTSSTEPQIAQGHPYNKSQLITSNTLQSSNDPSNISITQERVSNHKPTGNVKINRFLPGGHQFKNERDLKHFYRQQYLRNNNQPGREGRHVDLNT